MKKILKKKTKFNYIQSCGTYNTEILVSVGTNYKELLACAKRLKLAKKNIKALEDDKEEILPLMERVACFMNLPTGSILWIKEYEDEWTFYEYLIHEIFHAVYLMLGQDQRMMKEDEAMAYQLEFLFREIRRKLQNHFK